jgi:hypothetical protein
MAGRGRGVRCQRIARVFKSHNSASGPRFPPTSRAPPLRARKAPYHTPTTQSPAKIKGGTNGHVAGAVTHDRCESWPGWEGCVCVPDGQPVATQMQTHALPPPPHHHTEDHPPQPTHPQQLPGIHTTYKRSQAWVTCSPRPPHRRRGRRQGSRPRARTGSFWPACHPTAARAAVAAQGRSRGPPPESRQCA